MSKLNHTVSVPIYDYEEMDKALKDSQIEFEKAKDEGMKQGLAEQQIENAKANRKLLAHNDHLNKMNIAVDLQLKRYRDSISESDPHNLYRHLRCMPKWWRFMAVKKWKIEHQSKISKSVMLNEILYTMNKKLIILEREYENSQSRR
jgi:hypothetical protein